MKNLAELQAIKEKSKEKNDSYSTHVYVGLATCGIAAGAQPVFDAISEGIKTSNLSDVCITQVGCVGLCQYEPLVEIINKNGEKTTYVNMDTDKAKAVVEKHLIGGEVIPEYTVGNTTLA